MEKEAVSNKRETPCSAPNSRKCIPSALLHASKASACENADLFERKEPRVRMSLKECPTFEDNILGKCF